MGRSTKITDLPVRNEATQSAQFAAFKQAMLDRRHYAFSHVKTYLRVTPTGELHLCILGEAEHPAQHRTLSDPSRTTVWAALPFQCTPNAAAKSPGRLNALLD